MCINNNYSKEQNNTSQILIENIDEFENEVRKNTEIRYFGKLYFETCKFFGNNIPIDEKKEFAKILQIAKLKKFNIFFLCKKNTLKLIYRFYLISGKFNLNLENTSNGVIYDYVILLTENDAGKIFLFCLTNEKHIIIDEFKYCQIVSYHLLDNFSKNVSFCFKRELDLYNTALNYCSKQFFLLNDYNYLKSGKIRKFLVKDTNITLYDIYQILGFFKELKNIEVSEFLYQIPVSVNKPTDHFFIEIIKNTIKTNKIENIEHLRYNKNFLLEFKNIYNNVKFYIYVHKKNYLKDLSDFIKKTNKNTIDKKTNKKTKKQTKIQ